VVVIATVNIRDVVNCWNKLPDRVVLATTSTHRFVNNVGIELFYRAMHVVQSAVLLS